MKRRQVLAGAAGLALTGGAVWVSQNGIPQPSQGEGDETGGGIGVEVETLAAPGSEAGSMVVPPAGEVSVVDLFATWCAPCRAQMEELNAVRADYPEVSFVSVTNERVGGSLSRQDIADWWARHDGDWTVGVEPGGDLLRVFGAPGIPYTAVVDAEGTVVSGHSGLTGADTLREDLDEVV